MKMKQFNLLLPTDIISLIKKVAARRSCTLREAGASLLVDGLVGQSEDGLITSLTDTREHLMTIGRQQVKEGGHMGLIMWDAFTKANHGDKDKALVMMGHATLMNLGEHLLNGNVRVSHDPDDDSPNYLHSYIKQMRKFQPETDLPAAH